jgi:hypothetical protein
MAKEKTIATITIVLECEITADGASDLEYDADIAASTAASGAVSQLDNKRNGVAKKATVKWTTEKNVKL